MLLALDIMYNLSTSTPYFLAFTLNIPIYEFIYRNIYITYNKIDTYFNSVNEIKVFLTLKKIQIPRFKSDL